MEVLFEDQHLIVLSKPAGLLSQGDISEGENLVDLLRERFGRHYVGLVHRLDRNTSGLMVVAKRSKAAERLTRQLQSGELVRKYRAIVYGSLPLTSPLRWNHWLLKNEQTNQVRVVPSGTSKAKEAVLYAQPLRTLIHPTGEIVTEVEFELETGRGHQIRAQCQASGYPIIGDKKYGNVKSLTLFTRTALHSSFLSFLHPISHEKMTFEQRYSPDMIEFFGSRLD